MVFLLIFFLSFSVLAEDDVVLDFSDVAKAAKEQAKTESAEDTAKTQMMFYEIGDSSKKFAEEAKKNWL